MLFPLRRWLALGLLAAVLAGCGGGAAGTASTPTPFPTVASCGACSGPFTLSSPAFGPGKPIPRDYACDGANTSPPLAWSDPPAGTVSLALVVEDPDAPGGSFTHWVLYNLPGGTRSLPPGVPAGASGPGGSLQGPTSAGRAGYGGPCPPSGTHRYFFHLYALDTPPAVSTTADKAALLQAMQGHVLGQADLVGTYSR